MKKDGFVPLEKMITVDENQNGSELEITLQAAAGIILEPRFADGSTPSRLIILTMDDSGSASGDDYAPDEMGQVHLSTLPTGHVRLMLETDNSPATEVSVTVPQSQPIRVVLKKGSTLRIRIPELASQPSAAQASLSLPESDFVYRSGDVHNGEVTFSGITAGRWMVTVSTPDGRNWTKTDNVPEETSVDWTLDR